MSHKVTSMSPRAGAAVTMPPLVTHPGLDTTPYRSPRWILLGFGMLVLALILWGVAAR